ncbi:hypothetical protein TIFTF001_042201 [Ficus carica]|uniref:Uncharacterized protein n=1 Tax=Ficus carica TaxID=3494 RepID=A0AA88DED8_FICCA|nr:hypothetical protein TIFTF001_042201 [Ficus carica]
MRLGSTVFGVSIMLRIDILFRALANDLCLTSRRDLKALWDVLALSGTLGIDELEHPFEAFKSSY